MALIECITINQSIKDHMLRSEFWYPQDTIYLCGNSLGLQPKSVEQALGEELDVWREQIVDGHFHHKYNRPWLWAEEEVSRLMMPLVGAKHEWEVATMGELTTNLHLLMAAFYKPTATRYKVLIEGQIFPSDYVRMMIMIVCHSISPDSSGN
jgi:kynureninase